MKFYWYAPFNNANEYELAAALSRPNDELLVQATRLRPGQVHWAHGRGFEFIRDLPGIAGEEGLPATGVGRARLGIERATRRHRVIRAGQFDLCHLHSVNPYTDGIAFPLLRSKGRPLVVSVHNVRPHKHQMPRPLQTAILTTAYRAATHLIVAHEHLRDQVVQEFGIARERISILPLPAPDVLGGPLPKTRPEPARVLFFGTLRDNKGLPVFLSAVESLVGRTDAIFRVAGRGEARMEEMVTGAAERLPNLRGDIGYVEPEREAELYREATLVVIPYTSFAAQSGVLRVAYAYGVPAVVSDLGALGAAVRSERTGWVVPPSDPDALAGAILAALDDPMGRKAASDAMRAIAADRSPPVLASRLRALYEELA